MKNSFSSYLVSKWLYLFLETKNPIYAWRTYQTARSFGVDVPSEVMTYLDKVADQLVKIANDPPMAKVRPLEINKALGLGKRGAGPESLFKDYTERQKSLKIAIETFEEINRSGKEYIIFEELAKKYKSSESTIRRNYKKHLEKWGADAEYLIKEKIVEFGKDGKPKMQMAGTADDLREMAIILTLIEQNLNPT